MRSNYSLDLSLAVGMALVVPFVVAAAAALKSRQGGGGGGRRRRRHQLLSVTTVGLAMATACLTLSGFEGELDPTIFGF
jgi:hypothetical protein